MKLKNFNINQYRTIFLTFGFFTVLVISVADYFTNYKLGFGVFYLVPIMLTTWIFGRKFGILISILSAVMWFLLELILGKGEISSVIPYLSATMRALIFLSITYLLSAQSDLEKNLRIEKNLARKDMLTGAANRRLFFELAEVEIRRSRRYKHPFTLAYIDLDNFKKVNDTQGHNSGDNVLKVVVETIRKNIREIDLISRLSGDEFVILLPETNLDQAKVVIERTQKGLLFAMQKNGWPVTFSIGVVTFERTPSTADEMVKIADNLMYDVKKSGKNMVKYDVYQ
ncbi:MAG: GGDEF domain-containing protein [Endomicrobiia bacterium]